MVCPQWILKLISSYVGIIQIRFMGRSWSLPLSLPTSSPVVIIKFSFFSVSISTLQSIFYNLLANNSTNYFILFINSMWVKKQCFCFRHTFLCQMFCGWNRLPLKCANLWLSSTFFHTIILLSVVFTVYQIH